MSLGVVLIGAGRVGAAFITAVRDVPALTLRKVVIHRPDQDRSHLALPGGTFTTDGVDAVHSPDVDVVVDASSAPEASYLLAVATLRQGRLFATANKELAVDYGRVLTHLAATHGGQFRYDASVCASVPTTRVLAMHCKGDRIESIDGILSGTCNYLLSTMESERIEFSEALAQATALGFAEPDPTYDLDGTDAARKTTLLSRLAFGHVSDETVQHRGITGIARRDIDAARRDGRSIRLVSHITRTPTGGVHADIRPRSLRSTHALATARGVDSVVRIHSQNMGTVDVRGPGAGPMPTAAALISDALDAVRA